MNEVKQLREALGDKSYPSPMFEKEYYLGADTGDRVCSVCGRYEFEHPKADKDTKTYKNNS